MDPLQTQSKYLRRAPAFDIRNLKFVVHPMNVDGVHWVATVFTFDWTSHQDNVTIHMYDPLGASDTIEFMLVTWKSFTLGFRDGWLSRDHPGASFSDVIESTPDSSRQKDGYNCGFLCIVFVDMLANNRQLDTAHMKKDVVASSDLEALRYNILHLLIID